MVRILAQNKKAISERERRKRNKKQKFCLTCGKEISNTRKYCELCSSVSNKNNIKKSVRKSHLKKSYGITPEQYDEMFQRQGGVCAVCGKPPNGRKLSVDHDHRTGKVRALLCAHCNIALGNVDDNPSILQKLINYLTQ